MIENNSVKDRITIKAMSMFFSLGFSRVTMDELSADLGMSKKTIYKYFPGKDLLLKSVVNMVMHQVVREVDTMLQDTSLDFPKKLARLLGIIRERLARINRPLLRDVERQRPEIWKDIMAFRRKTINRNFKLLIGEGKKKGLIREDINSDLMLRIFIQVVDAVINPETLAQLPVSADQAFQTLMHIFFGGVLTEEGRTAFTRSGIISSKPDIKHS